MNEYVIYFKKNRMKKIIVLLLLFVRLQTLAQTDTALGIRFEDNSTWEQIKAKARKENKYIFMDCYASWCVPCKFMSQKIFTLPEVGKYMNATFVSVEIQMDKTKKDPEFIQKWYSTASDLGEKYSVNTFPTYLFFSPTGIPVHRLVGSVNEGKEFIEKAAEALNPSTQYYSLINAYKKHLRDSVFLRNAITSALKMHDLKSASLIGNSYINCLKDPYADDNISLIEEVTTSTADKGFGILMKYSLNGKNRITRTNTEISVENIIFDEELASFLKENAPSANWKNILTRIKRKCPYYADKIVKRFKPTYYRTKKQDTEFENSLIDFMNFYGEQVSPFEANNNAWLVFLTSNNPKIITEALKWSKRSIDRDSSDANNIDTYAHLFYKLGDKKNAIIWEKKAVEVATNTNRNDQVKNFSLVLEKMQKGEEIKN